MSACAEPHRVPLELLDDPTSLIYGIGNSGRQDDGLGWPSSTGSSKSVLCLAHGCAVPIS